MGTLMLVGEIVVAYLVAAVIFGVSAGKVLKWYRSRTPTPAMAKVRSRHMEILAHSRQTRL